MRFIVADDAGSDRTGKSLHAAGVGINREGDTLMRRSYPPCARTVERGRNPWPTNEMRRKRSGGEASPYRRHLVEKAVDLYWSNMRLDPSLVSQSRKEGFREGRRRARKINEALIRKKIGEIRGEKKSDSAAIAPVVGG